jgi:hypothetical protein
MARTLAPDLAAALPALVLWIRVTQARLEALERRFAPTVEGHRVSVEFCKGLGGTAPCTTLNPCDGCPDA